MMRKKSCGVIAAANGAVTALSSGAAYAATYQQTVINDAPIRYYRLGEASGPTAFDSTGTSNGTYLNFSPADFNQPGALIANSNGSANFDGLDNVVSAPHAADLNLPGNLTVEFWMNKTSESLNGDWARLVGKGSLTTTRPFGVWEEAGAGQRVFFQQYGAANTPVIDLFSNGTVPLNTWTHVVATINGNNAAIYLNGVLDASGTRSGAAGTDSSPLSIGKALPDLHTFFNGRIDEVALYNKALSPVQIFNHYLVATNQAPSSLPSEVLGDAPVAYYRHNDGPVGSQPLVMIDSAAPPQNGAYTGVTMVAGLPTQPGTAAGFNGSSSFARIDPTTITPFTSGAVNAFSFETWFNTTTGGVILGQTGAGSTPGTAGNPNGWVPALHVGTDGIVRTETFWHGAVDPIASPTAYNDGQWHHVVTTFDPAGTQRLYIDGVLVASQGGNSQVAFAGAYDFYLGTGYTSSWPGAPVGGGWHYFNGTLDETAIYHRALTLEEVMRHYIAGNTLPVPEPATASLALLGMLALGRRGRRTA